MASNDQSYRAGEAKGQAQVKTGQAMYTVKDKAQATKDKASEMAQGGTKDQSGGYMAGAKDKAAGAAEATKEKASQVAESEAGKEKTGGIMQKTGEQVMGMAKDKAAGAAEATKEKASQVAESGKETAEAGKEKTGGIMQKTGEQVMGMAQGDYRHHGFKPEIQHEYPGTSGVEVNYDRRNEQQWQHISQPSQLFANSFDRPISFIMDSARVVAPDVEGNQVITMPDQEEPQVRTGLGVEMLRSIVYGGLDTSVASLCIVVSSAATPVSPRGIITLGVAFTAGGIPKLCLPLYELYHTPPRAGCDRYGETYGRRERWLLHSIVAIISHIVCGLLAPLVYSFIHHIIGKPRLTPLAATGATLACTLLLTGVKYITGTPPRDVKIPCMLFVTCILAPIISYVSSIIQLSFP